MPIDFWLVYFRWHTIFIQTHFPGWKWIKKNDFLTLMIVLLSWRNRIKNNSSKDWVISHFSLSFMYLNRVSYGPVGPLTSHNPPWWWGEEDHHHHHQHENLQSYFFYINYHLKSQVRKAARKDQTFFLKYWPTNQLFSVLFYF